MSMNEVKPKIETEEEKLESYNDFKKRYYIYRADDIRVYIQRDGTELNELIEENEKMYKELEATLSPKQKTQFLQYAGSWNDIINVGADELTKYMLADFEEER